MLTLISLRPFAFWAEWKCSFFGSMKAPSRHTEPTCTHPAAALSSGSPHLPAHLTGPCSHSSALIFFYQLKDSFITEWPCVYYGMWWMQGRGAAWPEDGLCCTIQSYSHFSRDEESHKGSSAANTHLLCGEFATTKKCENCFFPQTPTRPLAPPTLYVSADQNTRKHIDVGSWSEISDP